MMRNKGIVISDKWKRRTSGIGKRWQVRVWDADVGRYKSKAFSDRIEGKRWAESEQRSIILGDSTAQVIKLSEIKTPYLAKLERLGRCADHIKAVERFLNDAIAFGIDDLTCRNVPEKAEIYVHQLKHRVSKKPAAPATKRKAMGALKAIGKFIKTRRAYALRYNPFDECELMRVITEARPVYSIEELRSMVSDENRDHDWWLFVVLLVYTGMRAADVVAFRWDWIKWDSNFIVEPAHCSKTKRVRYIPLQPELRDILRPIAKIGSSLVFEQEWPLNSTQRVGREVSRYIHGLGIKHEGRVVHDIRHSVAGMLTAMGMSHFLVMDYIGDSSTDVAKHYSSAAMLYLNEVSAWGRDEMFLRRKHCKDSKKENIPLPMMAKAF